MYLEPVCSSIFSLGPSKTRSFCQSKQGSFGFQVYIINTYIYFQISRFHKNPFAFKHHSTYLKRLTSPFSPQTMGFWSVLSSPPKTPRATKTQLPVAYLLGKSRRCCHPNRHSPNPNQWSSKDRHPGWMVDGGCVWWRAYRFTPVSYASCYNKNKDQWHNMMKNNIVWDSQLNWVTNKGITSTLGTRNSFLKEVFEKKTGTPLGVSQPIQKISTIENWNQCPWGSDLGRSDPHLKQILWTEKKLKSPVFRDCSVDIVDS